MPLISVIIPVYNAEEHLEKCINSIVNQTVQDFEIIIINDGSTDGSQAIIDDYSAKFPNQIKSFTLENGGVAAARNYGIEKSSGDYLCFVDSDDYVDVDLFEKLQQYTLNGYDIIKYKCKKVDECGKILEEIQGPNFINLDGEEAFGRLYSKDKLIDVVWLFLIKRNYWVEHGFEFPEGRYHEDWAVIPYAILKAKKVCSSEIYGYNYVQTEESITRHNKNEKIIKRATDMLFHYDNLGKKINADKIGKEAAQNFMIYLTNSLILRTEEIPKEYRKEYIFQLKKRKIFKNIKVRNIKQFVKRVILMLSINTYLKIR